MPNVALMIGVGLVTALVAGLFLLYNEDGFGNNHHQGYGANNGGGSHNNRDDSYGERSWREPPTHSNPGNSRGSKRSQQTTYSERYDTNPTTNGRRRRRRDEEDENCIICCDLLTSFEVCTISECGHKFHTVCLKKWVESESGSFSNKKSTCPHCRVVIQNPRRTLGLSA